MLRNWHTKQVSPQERLVFSPLSFSPQEKTSLFPSFFWSLRKRLVFFASRKGWSFPLFLFRLKKRLVFFLSFFFASRKDWSFFLVSFSCAELIYCTFIYSSHGTCKTKWVLLKKLDQITVAIIAILILLKYNILLLQLFYFYWLRCGQGLLCPCCCSCYPRQKPMPRGPASWMVCSISPAKPAMVGQQKQLVACRWAVKQRPRGMEERRRRGTGPGTSLYWNKCICTVLYN